MPIGVLLRVAGRALVRNALRTSLTMLGVIIGVAAVIGTLAIGEGAKASIQAQIASLGSNVIMVIAGSMSRGGVYTGSGTQTTLSEGDVLAIQRESQYVDRV